jgi:beta-glucosidase
VITYDGIHFSWPDTAAGKPDNVVASGQTLTVRGAGTRLAFLLTAGWGPAQGSATVLYSGGSTQKFAIGAPDWYLDCPGAGAPEVVAYTRYRNQGNGTVPEQSCVYYASIRLRSARSVKSIILPDISPPQPRNYYPSLHIFAITIS